MPPVKSLLDYRGSSEIGPMDQELAQMLMKITINSSGNEIVETAQEIYDRMTRDPETTIPFQAQVFLQRLISFSPESKLSFFAMLMMLCLCKNLGDVVMWAYAVHKHDKPMTLDELCWTWGNGFPTEETRHRCWEDQKSPSGANLLDLVETWGQK